MAALFSATNMARDDDDLKIHTKPRTKKRIKKALTTRRAFAVLFLLFSSFVLKQIYEKLRKQSLREAEMILGTGRKARTDLEGEVLFKSAVENEVVLVETVDFEDGSLDRSVFDFDSKERAGKEEKETTHAPPTPPLRKEEKRKEDDDDEEKKLMFHEETHDNDDNDNKQEDDNDNDSSSSNSIAGEEKESTEEDGVDGDAGIEVARTEKEEGGEETNDDDDDDDDDDKEVAETADNSAQVGIEEAVEEFERNDGEEQDEEGVIKTQTLEEETVEEGEDDDDDEPLEDVKPGAGDADDLNAKLPRSQILPMDPSKTCSVDRLRALFKPCLLGGDVLSCCGSLDKAFAPESIRRFEDQEETEEDTTANCLCVFTAMSDLNETFSQVGLNVYEDVLGKCEPDSRKFGWFGDGTEICPEDNLDELRRRKDEETRMHEEARKERERKKKEIYKRNVERAKKMEAARVESALKRSDTERQARELRRREREENLRKEARLVTWRLKEAKSAEKALREAEAKQAKFFSGGGGIEDVGCYEEGEKPTTKGQKPC
jgi:hypothetical protein